MQIKVLLLLALGVNFLSGCMYYLPTAVSTNPVGTQYERPVDVVSGQSSAYYLFGSLFGPMGDDSLYAAVEDALSNRKASSISNVFVDRRFICVPFPCQWGYSLFTRVDTMIYGTLISYGGETYLGRGSYSKADITQQIEPSSISSSKDTMQSIQPSEEKCVSYDCLILLSPEEQKKAVEKLSPEELKLARKRAKEKIKVCFPEKTPSIVVDIEIIMLSGEKEFLEYFCKTGLFKN